MSAANCAFFWVHSLLIYKLQSVHLESFLLIVKECKGHHDELQSSCLVSVL